MSSTTPSPSDTKDRILDAAEAAFADRGYAAASMRTIASAAGVNLAAGHYHFGSKRGLFQAVLERRVGALNDERLHLLDELERRTGGRPALEDVLAAFLGPPVRRCAEGDEGWARFLRLMGRAMGEGGEHVDTAKEVFRRVQVRFLPALRAALPDLDENDFFWRMNFLVGAMCHHLSDPARVRVISDGRCTDAEPEEALRQLLTFAVGAFRAPTCAGSTVTAPEDRR